MSENMFAYKCNSCGELHHPKHFVCRKCGSKSFQEVPLEGEVTLLTFTKVYNLPEGYMKPYLAFGIVKFDNGLTVSGQIDCEHIEIGMKLKSSIGIIKEGIGRDYFGFVFKPID